MKAHIRINEEHNGIEINFDSKPSADIREQLKSNGFRWHKVNKVWYAKNTGKTMELASKISQEIGNGAELAELSAQKAKEKSDALEIPDAEEIDGGGLYDGWKGGNNYKWRTDAELKECLRADFKKAGIKATFRFPRCGYLTSLIVTITLPKEGSIKPYEEWRESFSLNGAWGWLCYKNEDGKFENIHVEKFYTLPKEEQKELYEKIARTTYELNIESVGDENTHRPKEESVLTEKAARVFNLAKRIVGSYNRDCTNSMIDYFDRDIYDDYRIKFA